MCQTMRQLFTRSLTRWTAAAGALCFSLIPSSDLMAQDPSNPSSNIQYTLPYNDASGSASAGGSGFGLPFNDYNTQEQEPNVAGGTGFKFRVGHEAGDTVGRSQSITYFDLAPYVFVNDLILFGEGRLGVGNNGDTAGSVGGGARYYLPRMNSVVGVSGWFDMDQSRGPMFKQWGLSGEFLSEYLDIRGNWYSPVGDTFKITSERFEAGSQHFIDRPLPEVPPGDPQGSYLAFQRRVFTATAMRGFDTLFSTPLPGKFPQRFNMEAGAGFYNYSTSDNSVDEAWGWRARLDMDIMERTSHMFLEVMHDRVFKTNVVFGIDVNYWNNLGHRPRVGHSQHYRLAEWVRRNRTVVAFEGSYLSDPELAINPNTSNPYVIYQVWENPANVGPEDGTTANPFQTLNAALAANGADILFVRSGSVINNAVSIDTPNLQVIGEQALPTIQIRVQNLSDNVVLPTVYTGAFEQPVVDGVAGQYAVRLNADHTRFAGIDITNFTGTGAPNSAAILAEGRAFGGASVLNTIDTVNVENVIDANGLYLADLSGTMAINDLTLTSIGGGDAVHIERGSANILFTGTNNRIDNTDAGLGAHGYAVQLIDTAGNVNMSTVSIADNGGAGIRVVGNVVVPSTANISFADVELNGSQAAAGEGVIHIEDFNGRVSFGGELTIDQAGGADGDSFVVRNLQPSAILANSGVVQVSGQANFLNRRGTGILVEDLMPLGTSQSRVLFTAPVNINGLDTGFAGTDPAIHFNTPTGTLQFFNIVNIDRSLGNGVEIANIADDGTTNAAFFIADNTINISNVNQISFNVSGVEKEAFNVRTGGLMINNRGSAGSTGMQGAGVVVFDFAGTAAFTGQTTVNNQNNSFANAITILSNDPVTFDKSVGGISFGSINVANQLGAGSYGVLVRDNIKEGGVNLGSVSVTATNAEGILLENNRSVTITGGTIDTTNSRAITVQTTGTGVPGTTDPQQHFVRLDSVTAEGADYGILVNNSQGQFIVSGQTGVNGSGGTISDMSVAGASFQNTQVVELQNMNFNGNQRGIVGQSLLRNSVSGDVASMFLNNVSVNASDAEGIFLNDVRTFILQNSRITNNGAVDGTEQIDFLASTARADLNNDSILENVNYVARILNNNITDSRTANAGNANMIFVRTAAGISQPVNLDLLFQNNGANGLDAVVSNRSNASALNVTWTGDVSSTISGNRFETLTGANQTAIRMVVTGSGDEVNIFNNSFLGTGNGATGIYGDFLNTSTISIRDNQQRDEDGNLINNSGMLFTGLGSTGINLSVQESGSFIDVSNNLIQFGSNARSGTGIQFSHIVGSASGGTTVAINGNTIELYPNNVGTIITQEVGINFVSILGSITLQGTENNSVFPQQFLPFYYDFLPLTSNQFIGTIIVNNQAVPQ